MSCLDYSIKNKRKTKCPICGKQFFTVHPKKKTCSIECSMILKEKTAKQANEDTKRYYLRKTK